MYQLQPHSPAISAGTLGLMPLCPVPLGHAGSLPNISWPVPSHQCSSQCYWVLSSNVKFSTALLLPGPQTPVHCTSIHINTH